jgi:dipeptidyl aminopeptidase/acylaminoacyl peptidase
MGCVLSFAMLLDGAPSQAERHRFTVADDIALAHFGDPYTSKVGAITFSPDGRYFVVDTERGLLERNRPESTLRLYHSGDVRHLLRQPERESGRSPIWMFSESTYKNGPITTHIRWLSDSSGFAFLVKTLSGNDRLFLADIRKRTIEPLTPLDHDVVAFDIRDRAHFVYAVPSAEIERRAITDSQATSIVGTGRDLFGLMFLRNKQLYDLSDLWACVDGRRFRVESSVSHGPIRLYRDGLRSLAISPDGLSVLAALAVKTVPSVWTRLYPSPTPQSAYHIRAGNQDVESFNGGASATQYAKIELLSGSVITLVDAPTGASAGWWTSPVSAAWSQDGTEVLMLNTFLASNSGDGSPNDQPPCAALVDLRTHRAACLEYLAREGDKNSSYIDGAEFIDPSEVAIHQTDVATRNALTETFVRYDSGSWAKSRVGPPVTEDQSFNVEIKQSFKDPPVLVATDQNTKISRVILDPNPQLKDIDLAESSLFNWKDSLGREWTGGLFKPQDYLPGKRYPLVIQTHGFAKNEFRPFGAFPTADAAQELASEGIVVLQAPGCPITIDPDEGACSMAQYESAISQLVDDGIVDPNRIGIVGFSRTCYFVLRALTQSKWHFQAASITDGVNEGYLQYLIGVDYDRDAILNEADSMIGARPFREGLEIWLRNSPTFNLGSVTTPLQVVGIGIPSLLSMWEPYAALRALHKPVNLIEISGGTHVLTNPRQRMVSQGGSVDWFRFWLEGYEDPDPLKKKQYADWRELRKLQDQNQSNAPTN